MLELVSNSNANSTPLSAHPAVSLGLVVSKTSGVSYLWLISPAADHADADLGTDRLSDQLDVGGFAICCAVCGRARTSGRSSMLGGLLSFPVFLEFA
jgi:hypothetical protein